MVNILYIQMADHGIPNHVLILGLNTYFIQHFGCRICHSYPVDTPRPTHSVLALVAAMNFECFNIGVQYLYEPFSQSTYDQARKLLVMTRVESRF
jgi:hypothetical protein